MTGKIINTNLPVVFGFVVITYVLAIIYNCSVTVNLNTKLNYTLCLRKNDTDVTHYRFNPYQPILVIFGRDVAERVCYWMVIYYPTSPN